MTPTRIHPCNCPMCGELWNGERCQSCGWKEPKR